MKPKNRWPEAHVNLKRLYDERAPSGMSQAEFGAQYDIGTQGMVWQYLHGHRPLNFEAAAKFAAGLRCTIHDISPEMAEALKVEIVPVLGPKWFLRAAAAKTVIALMLVIPLLLPTKSFAGTIFSTMGQAVYYVKSFVRRFFCLKAVQHRDFLTGIRHDHVRETTA
jgi:transcriptional regulator with XRE-family HTH domain